jgi:multidrug efflux pump subunit AcrA (membrane-fusion protein)
MPSFPALLLFAGAGLLLADGLAIPPLRAQPAASPAAQVAVVRARNGCFAATIRVTGFLVARSEAVVTLDTPGARLTEVLVNEGDRVTAGQILARLTRTEGPGGTGSSTTSTLRAPAAGLVIRSTAVVGATPSPTGEPLFRIAVDNDIELEAEVPSIHVPALGAGQAARVEVGADSRELSGRVRLVPATIDQRTQLGRARVSLERASSLKPGMFARATIDAKRSCGISVPRAAVRFRTDGTSVQIVRNDVVETRRIQVGFFSDSDIEIREGVRDGELVVANAGSSLQDGDRVRAVVADASAEQR